MKLYRFAVSIAHKPSDQTYNFEGIVRAPTLQAAWDYFYREVVLLGLPKYDPSSATDISIIDIRHEDLKISANRCRVMMSRKWSHENIGTDGIIEFTPPWSINPAQGEKTA